MWCKDVTLDDKDSYAGFRGSFELTETTDVEIRILGAAWYMTWLDGEYLTEGPPRFPIAHPEYEVIKRRLGAGTHRIAAQVHHIGLTTRMMADMPPFYYCELYVVGRKIPVTWRCTKLPGYASRVRRINSSFGWVEWCDTRDLPADWKSNEFDDSQWSEPIPATTRLGPMKPLQTGSVQRFTIPLKPIAEGKLVEMYGYERDDPPARFFLRDLDPDPKGLPVQGVWRRYDLGVSRLGRPRFVLDLPRGAVVEFGYCDYLSHGRVAPYITLGGLCCNLDHYVARGGVQEFTPITSKGMRFFEVHVIAPTESGLPDIAPIRFVEEQFYERCYYGAPEGSFSCGDPLLDKIWRTGVATYRACAEDAMLDTPTRERGQWTGDIISVGMEIGGVSYADLRLFRRSLVQSAYCARKDGLVAGLCPGECGYLSTYSAQWITGCLRYYALTGDRSVLEEMYPYAICNIAAYRPCLTPDGLLDGTAWAFVDWGYDRNAGPIDMAYNMHYLAGLRAMVQWSTILGQSLDRGKYSDMADSIETVVRSWIKTMLAGGKDGWKEIGYHSAALALGLGLVDVAHVDDCIAFIKRHILSCFPNNPDAPRLSDPGVANKQIITPYFAHYAFPPLIEHGQMDFVLDQYRKCWGWALEDGRTTWLEVFDTRWGYCHEWSGCPTWQLSRYVLGLQPRYDLGVDHFTMNLQPGSLPKAEGSIPIGMGKGMVHVKWTRERDGIHYRIETDRPIYVHGIPGAGEPVLVEKEWDRVIRPSNGRHAQ